MLLCADVRDALHARRPAPGDEPKEVGLLAASLGPHLVCLADTQVNFNRFLFLIFLYVIFLDQFGFVENFGERVI